MKLTATYAPKGLPPAKSYAVLYSTDNMPIPAPGLYPLDVLVGLIGAKVEGVIQALTQEVDRQEVPLYRREEVRWYITATREDQLLGIVSSPGYLSGFLAATDQLIRETFPDVHLEYE